MAEIISDEPWPMCCCVASFLVASLAHFGTKVQDYSDVARRLGTRISPKDGNNWGLYTEADPELLGVTLPEAKRILPTLLNEFNHCLKFTHIPFNEVPFGMFDDLFSTMYGQGAQIGIGFNIGRFLGLPYILRHVCRVKLGTDINSVLLVDEPTITSGRKYTSVDWEELEKAVHDIGDGFWVIQPTLDSRIDTSTSLVSKYDYFKP